MQGAKSKSLRWRWWLVAASVGFILLASTSLMSAERTGQAIKQVTRLILPNASPDQLRRLNFVIRKTAHLVEYAGLAALTAWALLAAFPRTVPVAWFFIALMLTAMIAFADEFHQSLVPSRTGAVRDVGIDVCGGLLALTAIAAWRWRRARRLECAAELMQEAVKEIAGPQWNARD